MTLADRLAREAATLWERLAGDDLEDCSTPERDSARDQCRVVVADAVRCALDEAAKAIMETEIVLDDNPFARWTTKGGRVARAYAEAIERLKSTERSDA